ncbi:MAG: hypothetical protein ABSC08_06510 [Bryobacteraceae bacterium]|jgi:hypothetical protein
MEDDRKIIELGRICKEPIIATNMGPDTLYLNDSTGRLGYVRTSEYTPRRDYRPEDRQGQRRDGGYRGASVQLRLDQYMS